MYYLKTLFFNFFVVFFANHILPGIDVVSQTKLPHLGGDLMFAIALGFINSLIYPLLKLCNQVSFLKIGGLALVINLVAYAILKIAPIGVHVVSFTGYFSAALIAAVGSFLTNFLEMKHKKQQGCCTPMPSVGEEIQQIQPK